MAAHCFTGLRMLADVETLVLLYAYFSASSHYNIREQFSMVI